MRFLVCIVEGHGEVDAAPVVVKRVIREILRPSSEWHVREDPVRQPRSSLLNVSDAGAGSLRPSSTKGIERALRMAAAHGPHGILVMCDADNDCPAGWGPRVPLTVEHASMEVPVRAVMASREYESWILAGLPVADRERAKAPDPERLPRDAKGALRRLVPQYTPTTHQVEVTRKMDLHSAWAISDSFDKLVRSVASLVGAQAPQRPPRGR